MLDAAGVIVRVNPAWSSCALQNGGVPGSVDVGTHYLAVCEAASGAEISQIQVFAAEIRNLLNGKTARFSMESRARVIGATIAMENPGEGGFRVTCRIPV